MEEKWRAAVALGGEEDGGAGCVLTGHRGGAVVFFLEKWGDRLRAGKKKTPGGKKERKKSEAGLCLVFFFAKRRERRSASTGKEGKNGGLSHSRLKIKTRGLPWFFDGGCPGEKMKSTGGRRL